MASITKSSSVPIKVYVETTDKSILYCTVDKLFHVGIVRTQVQRTFKGVRVFGVIDGDRK